MTYRYSFLKGVYTFYVDTLHKIVLYISLSYEIYKYIAYIYTYKS